MIWILNYGQIRAGAAVIALSELKIKDSLSLCSFCPIGYLSFNARYCDPIIAFGNT